MEKREEQNRRDQAPMAGVEPGVPWLVFEGPGEEELGKTRPEEGIAMPEVRRLKEEELGVK